MLGTVINARYEVLEKVGSGGMGSVYRVRDRDHEGREVALKLLTPQEDSREVAQHRFKREFRALSRLSHANIIAVYEWGVHEGTLSYTMEFVRGESLRAWSDLTPRQLLSEGIRLPTYFGLFRLELEPCETAEIELAGSECPVRLKAVHGGLATKAAAKLRWE